MDSTTSVTILSFAQSPPPITFPARPTPILIFPSFGKNDFMLCENAIKKYPTVLHTALFLGYFRSNPINTKEKNLSYNMYYVALGI